MTESDKEARKIPPAAAEDEPETAALEQEDEQKSGNPHFALKVLAILVAIILLILILQSSGVPIAIRDWFRATADALSLLPLQ